MDAIGACAAGGKSRWLARRQDLVVAASRQVTSDSPRPGASSARVALSQLPLLRRQAGRPSARLPAQAHS